MARAKTTRKPATAKRPPAKYVVSLGELARISGRSEPTLKGLVEEYTDFPVIKRGGKGVAWEIDVRAAKAWLDAHDVRLAEKAAERADHVRSLQLEIFGKSIDGEAADALSPEDRAKVAQAKLAENKLAEQQGRLVRRDDVRRIAESAFLTLRKELQPLGSDLAKRYGLGREARLEIENVVRGALNRCADRLEMSQEAAAA